MDLRTAPNAVDDDYDEEPPVPIQTETIDVYLLRPEESREIEIKDFTIMKPNKSKMHRLIRFYPHCDITYRATLSADETTVMSLSGTVANTILPENHPRQNGGFSNPSRNAEIFRLKSDLLQEYFASVQDDDREAAMFDALIGRCAHPAQHPSSVFSAGFSDQPEKNDTALAFLRERRSLPKFKRVEMEEDCIPLAGYEPGCLTPDERLKYVSSLWPSLAPVDDDEDIMYYYGIEVQIVSEKEREKDLAVENELEEKSDMQKEGKLSLVAATSVTGMALIDIASSTKAEGKVSSSETAPTCSPEKSTKSRSAAFQKLEEAAVEDDDEIKPNPIATKQDDWVQCDKCQKWRRLPNQVNVSELPAIWYCKMNRWDKHHNKCAAQEEKLVVYMKGADLAEYRQRKFVQDFVQRCKRLDKLTHHYMYTHFHDDDGERKFVQCMECLKLRPLIGGMDPNKVAEPFVCWMNWDELLASCSAPEGLLYPRTNPERYNSAARCESSVLYVLPDVAEDDAVRRKGFHTVSDPATFGDGRACNKSGRKGKRKNGFGTTENGASAGKAGMGKKTKRRTLAQ
ncbi:unnamed protein product [Peronospora belbahrii]|uniref:CW-type domain-containing protein n=1 Tax=Peronospora belbahrii TaxID=622444 RepID=A0AAU9KRC1_9STRA|nr:unnamed protein product [Peronospora belbahrii]